MICPANVNRSTIAAHNRGSVHVFVHEENGSLDAMAMAERSFIIIITPTHLDYGLAMLVKRDKCN